MVASAQVLVVEDEKIVAKAIQSELRSLGYAVPSIAATGEEALQQAWESRPDLVLMDIVLRGTMDGIETARQLRLRMDVPVVYLTAYGDEATLTRAKATEPFGYLLKPYIEKELHAAIEMSLYKHRLEKKLRETNLWLGAMLRSIDNGVIATDSCQRIRILNPVAENLTGWKQVDAQDRDLVQVCHLVDNNQRNLLLSLGTQAILERRVLPFGDEDAWLISRLGTPVPVEGSIATLQDDDKNLFGLVVIFRDVTGRKQIEKLQRQSEEHIRHSQKMEAVSRLAGGIAHDFNKLLATVHDDASLLAANLGEANANLHLAERIESTCERAATMVRQLLAFSGRVQLTLDSIDLNCLIQTTLRGFQENWDARVGFDFAPAPDLWHLRGDRHQLSEMFNNLCYHAAESMPQGGQLSLETANVTIQEDHLRSQWQAQPGDFVRLRVQDTGGGIKPEVQSRLFEPFGTPSETGDGTGLNLALVYGITQVHGGWIECTSVNGHGTRFDIYLPRCGASDSLP